MKGRRTAIALFGCALIMSGCSSNDTSSDGGATLTLNVLAASSLTDAFPEIGTAFSAAHPDVKVQFSFAGSQELVAQADSGAPADVLALAGTNSLDVLEASTGGPVIFARNRLTIIVPTGNPAGVDALTDLANPDVKVALAGPEVPAGAYALDAFDKAGISVNPVSEETDVKAVVTRVAIGGADAGVVYVTDALASDADIESVDIPARLNVVATYPAAGLTASENSEMAQQFVDYLTEPAAQQTLNDYGFESP
ncbi:MAG: molybdate ABC transporter substrate-binding protein [Actinomycetia bacterium]|nr:molybdate ABC transporter substrate-binding protein [Actinomycetes bacterium]